MHTNSVSCKVVHLSGMAESGAGPSKSEDVIVGAGGSDKRWDTAFRRDIRKQQREIINDVHKNRDDISIPDELIKRVEGLNKLYKNVVATKEAAIDSEGFRLLSSIGREQVESTHGEMIQFDTAQFAEKLITFMDGRRQGNIDTKSAIQLNWERLGERSMKAFKRPPTVNFLLGTLDLEPLKKKKQAVRRKLDKESASKSNQPKELTTLDDDEESTTKDVAHVLKCLKDGCAKEGRVHYFKFLVDPDSFAHTVENMFHFSFLIKEGRAGMSLGRDGQPYVYIPRNTTVDGQSIKDTKNQAIISFSMSDWERAKLKYAIKKSFIPVRD